MYQFRKQTIFIQKILEGVRNLDPNRRIVVSKRCKIRMGNIESVY